MSNQKELRDKREIAQSEARDKTAKIFSGLVPGGASAYELFTAIVKPLHEKRKEEWVREVTIRLSKLEQRERIDLEELSRNEEFNTIITKATILAQQTHQKEKHEALRNIVVKSAAGAPKLVKNFDETDYFLNLLSEINPTQIFLLKLFNNPEAAVKDLKSKVPGDPTLNSWQVISYLYPDLQKKKEVIAQYWRELQRLGLMVGNDITIGRHTKYKIQKLTTELGDRFLEMISDQGY